MNRLTCLQVEPLLAEYLDGALAAPDRDGVEEHVASCAGCQATLEDVRVALAWTRAAEPVPVPSMLVARILEQTSEAAGAGARGWAQRLRGWFRPMLEPRFAMGTAMALISFSLLLNATGVNMKDVRLADLSPANLYFSIDRQAHLAGSRAVKFYRDLRIVYEIQSQLQALREEAAPPAEKKKPESPPQPQRKRLNRNWSRDLSVMAMLVR